MEEKLALATNENRNIGMLVNAQYQESQSSSGTQPSNPETSLMLKALEQERHWMKGNLSLAVNETKKMKDKLTESNESFAQCTSEKNQILQSSKNAENILRDEIEKLKFEVSVLHKDADKLLADNFDSYVKNFPV